MSNNFLQLAAQTAVKAGAVIMEIYHKKDRGETLKIDQTPLTIADLKSNEIIENALQLSKIPILSEEDDPKNQDNATSADQYWVVDPLDGTHEFINRNGEFTINIALTRNHKPILGVIYIPCLNELYLGDKEHGAWLLKNIIPGQSVNLAKIKETGLRLPLINKNEQFTLVGSKSHLTKATENFISKLGQSLLPLKFIRVGSAVKFCKIATGEADLYPRMDTIMVWDSAAGQAIIETAGGQVKSWPRGEPLTCFQGQYKNPPFIAIAPGRDSSLFFYQ